MELHNGDVIVASMAGGDHQDASKTSFERNRHQRRLPHSRSRFNMAKLRYIFMIDSKTGSTIKMARLLDRQASIPPSTTESQSQDQSQSYGAKSKASAKSKAKSNSKRSRSRSRWRAYGWAFVFAFARLQSLAQARRIQGCHICKENLQGPWKLSLSKTCLAWACLWTRPGE